jgi:D-glycero-D-manno-heptose 1,7-bisphosphate phosphatase
MLVLLDRDGVLNVDIATGVYTPEQFKILPGALEAVVQLHKAGFHIAVVTNQSVVGKGLCDKETVEHIHARLASQTAKLGGKIDAFFCCYDHPETPTSRRKPAPGMLFEALRQFHATPQHTPFIGDALRDLQAATAAGCPRILVKSGKGEQTLRAGLPGNVQPVTVCADINEAASHIIHTFSQCAE